MLAAVQLALLLMPQHTKGGAPERKKRRVPADNVSIFFNAGNHAINMLCNVRACYY